ncbi:hypothetical protein Tco_0359571 [Tanacetum coccineum]
MTTSKLPSLIVIRSVLKGWFNKVSIVMGGIFSLDARDMDTKLLSAPESNNTLARCSSLGIVGGGLSALICIMPFLSTGMARENTNSVLSNQRMRPIAPSVPLKLIAGTIVRGSRGYESKVRGKASSISEVGVAGEKHISVNTP